MTAPIIATIALTVLLTVGALLGRCIPDTVLVLLVGGEEGR